MCDQLKYLDHYKTLEEPGFAVLVKGEWGVGKTYQVKAKLPEDERYYLSLFGLKSSHQIYAALLGQVSGNLAIALDGLFPVKSWKLKIFGFQISPPKSLLEFGVQKILLRTIDTRRIIVFDDLERSSISFVEMWGVINQLVEHQSLRVLIICHDKKMKKQFRKQAEKIIGHDILISANPSAAKAIIETSIAGIHQKSLAPHFEVIVETFHNSQVSSLRVLRRCLADLLRLCDCLDEAHFTEADQFKTIICYFFAFALGIRGGHFTVEQLHHSLGGSYLSASSKDAKTEEIFKEFYARHSDIHPFQEVLNEPMLVNIFKQGVFDKEQIVSYLNTTLYRKFEQWPAWRRFMEFDHLEDEDVDAIIKEMDQQFDGKLIANLGELLHIFALRLLLVTKEQDRGSLDDEVMACKAYLDYLAASSPTTFENSDNFELSDRRQSHGGYAFFIINETRSHFAEVGNYLISKQTELFQAKYPSICDDLLNLMTVDAEAFEVCISNSGEGDNVYAMVPVFKDASAKDVVARWMEAPKSNWASISKAFKERYSGLLITRELKDEMPFAQELIAELKQVAENTEGMASLRIRRHIPDIVFPKDEASH